MGFVNVTRKQAEEILRGILSGDGDIYGRMSDGGEPSYPDYIDVIAPLLYESLDPSSDIFGKGDIIVGDFMKNHVFLGE